MPLQPMRNPPVGSEIILNAPMMAEQHISPVKSQPFTQAEMNYANLNYIPIPPPQPGAKLYTESPVKRPTVPSHAQFHPMQMMMQQQSLFTTFDSNFGPYQQENILPASATQENFVEFPEPSYPRKQALKRSYSDVEATIERPFKKAKADELAVDIPAPEDMPPVVDDGNKPNLSYAQMIGMAILRAPNRRLTLSQIYEWISNTFAYYREDTKQSWHNSIRHNLSLHKAFIKKERPKGDAGKGCYWMIEPGTEGSFFKDKNRRGNLSNMSIQPGIMRPELMKMAQPLSDALTPNLFINQSSEPPRPRTAPALPELSSDATLPASDPALNEQDVVNSNEGSLSQPKSSPPNALNSSPPLVGGSHRRNISSPTARVQRPSPAQRQKRIFPKPDDSGYFSSIESSALKPNKNKIVLTSELDIEPPSKKRAGRAEEEIARLRASSHDITPNHARFGSLNGDVVPLSSPVRVSPTTAAYPVTPAVRFKKPQRPPPSISPNTQLHNHRKAMQDFRNSPMKGFGLSQTDPNPSSPFGNSFMTPVGLGDESFEIFSDPVNTFTPFTPAFTSSPLKLYQSRPPLGRAATSGNVLAELDGGALKLNGKTPNRNHLLKATVGATNSGSPLKSSMNNTAPFDVQNDLFDFNSFENDMSDNDEGVDILQGFGKIGDPTAHLGGHIGGSQQMNRPSLGSRSHTSLF